MIATDVRYEVDGRLLTGYLLCRMLTAAAPSIAMSGKTRNAVYGS